MRAAPYRLGTVKCEIEEPFVYNDEFELMRIGNPEYFVNGEVRFPPGPSKDGTYRTKFGGAIVNAVIYADSDHNFRLAMRRLTGKRLPLTPGAHEELQLNQLRWFRENSPVMERLKEMYRPAFDDYKGSETEAIEHHADPHQKRLLRISAFNELSESGDIARYGHLWAKSVWWKMKKNEYAKPGKKPRGICDLGVSASLRGAWITEKLKTAQAGFDLVSDGGRYCFCKSPDPFELERHFKNLIAPEGRFYFVYFSDDSVLSMRQRDGSVRMYNLDISSCDASHGPAVFDALKSIVPDGECRKDIEILVDQCQLPLRIKSKSHPNLCVFLKPKVPKLLSGSTITTAINNLANLAIAMEIVRSYVEAPDGVENPSMVAAAARVGYILTGCTPVKTPQEIQFLKHSPVLDTAGQWRPMLNLGVLIRASMTCDGDLPGKGVLMPRALAFQRGILSGMYPYLTTEILQLMWKTIGTGPTRDLDFSKKIGKLTDYPRFVVDREEIVRRYSLTPLEYNELLDFARLGIGEFIHNGGVSKVLKLDYGLETHSAITPTPYSSLEIETRDGLIFLPR